VAALAAGGWYMFSSGNTDNTEDPPSSDAVAIVDGEEITRDQLEAIQPQVAASQGVDIATLTEEELTNLQTQTIDVLVGQALLRQAIEKSGVSAPQADVDAQISATKEQLGGQEAFDAELTAQGVTEEDLREQISEQLSTILYLNQTLELESLSVSDEEIQTAYDQAVAAGEEVPPLEEVRSQIEGALFQQKQQISINQHIQKLRSEAEVEILI